MKTVSVLIPVRNEEVALPYVLADVLKVRYSLVKKYNIDVIVIDDHSSDNTYVNAKQFPVTVIKSLQGSGKGCALRTGFSKARGEYVIILDGDYSHQAKDILKLLEKLDDGAGMVIGSRILGGTEEYTRMRAFGNEILTFFLNVFLKSNLTDALNGFKAFRRAIITDFIYTSVDFEIEIELIANTVRKGAKIIEVPTHERARMGGVSKSRIFYHGAKFLIRILYECLLGL